MASIIDSFRDVYSDKFAFFKVGILAGLLDYSYNLYLSAAHDNNFSGFHFVAGATLILLLGFFIKTLSNIISEKDFVLPSLNPWPLLVILFKSLLAVGVYAWITISLASYVASLINILPWVDIVLESILWLVVVSIILAALLMFCRHEKILEAYNVKTVLDRAGDLIVVVLFFVLQLVVINLPTFGFFGYTIFIIFGVGQFFNFFIAYTIVFNLAVAAHYMGQAHYEIFSYNEV